jgi:hypothetical protein
MSHLEDSARSSGGHAVAPATVSEKRERPRPSDLTILLSIAAYMLTALRFILFNIIVPLPLAIPLTSNKVISISATL